MRDDFSKKTKEILAKRVAYVCSNPLCRKPTIGPHSDSNKALLIGIAAHITAASPGGPRFSPNITKEERQLIENGIWLCENCASLIDKDPVRFPENLLINWKEAAENEAFQAIQNLGKETSEFIEPFAEVVLEIAKRSKVNMGLSHQNVEIYGDEPVELDKAIWVNLIRWHYKLRIYNNSEAPIYNVRLYEHPTSSKQIRIEKVPNYNDIDPFRDLTLKTEFGNYYESTGKVSVDIMESEYPEEIRTLKTLICYLDKNGKEYFSEFEFYNGQVQNRHLRIKPDEYNS